MERRREREPQAERDGGAGGCSGGGGVGAGLSYGGGAEFGGEGRGGVGEGIPCTSAGREVISQEHVENVGMVDPCQGQV